MTNLEKKKIALILFHVIALLFLIISGVLLLDDILQSEDPNEYLDSFSLNISRVLTLIAIFIGSISWFTMIINWILDKKLDEYLKLALFLTTLLITGLILLI